MKDENEWMYELNKKEKLQKWKKYQEACVAYFSEEYERALGLFEEFIDDSAKHPESFSEKEKTTTESTNNPTQFFDQPANNFVRVCREKLGLNKSSL